ncbi:MAG: hypothetical protein ACRYGK_05910 [Janthinobacterium lividum]
MITQEQPLDDASKHVNCKDNVSPCWPICSEAAHGVAFSANFKKMCDQNSIEVCKMVIFGAASVHVRQTLSILAWQAGNSRRADAMPAGARWFKLST